MVSITMFNKSVQALNSIYGAILLAATQLYFSTSAALAKDPLEAAQDLAGTNQSDPNGFTLMIVSIGMLFVFAITLIVATSVHVFKKKPQRQGLRQPSASYTSSAAQR